MDGRAIEGRAHDPAAVGGVQVDRRPERGGPVLHWPSTPPDWVACSPSPPGAAVEGPHRSSAISGRPARGGSAPPWVMPASTRSIRGRSVAAPRGREAVPKTAEPPALTPRRRPHCGAVHLYPGCPTIARPRHDARGGVGRWSARPWATGPVAVGASGAGEPGAARTGLRHPVFKPPKRRRRALRRPATTPQVRPRPRGRRPRSARTSASAVGPSRATRPTAGPRGRGRRPPRR